MSKGRVLKIWEVCKKENKGKRYKDLQYERIWHVGSSCHLINESNEEGMLCTWINMEDLFKVEFIECTEEQKMSKEYRIYVDKKLVNICYNHYALMSNTIKYNELYEKDKVEVKECDGAMDIEKRNYLNNLNSNYD